jgi:AraC-like DNA-binding protein
MKVYQEFTPVTGMDLFVILDSMNNGFEYPLHNHPEFELTFVSGSSGTRIVGDSTRIYKDEDLVFIGPYLFHKWDDTIRQGTKDHPCRVITIQFDMHLFDKAFLSKKPFTHANWSIQAGYSVLWKNAKRGRPANPLLRLSGVPSALLFTVGRAVKIKNMNTGREGFNVNPVQVNSKRLHAAYQYIMKHFKESSLKMSDVAAEVNLGDSAFSHFFKKATNRSFSAYLIAMRIEHACKLLIETDEQISRVAFMSGFNNIANFNRIFKETHQCTPLHFRKLYQEKSKFDWNKQLTPGQFLPRWSPCFCE